MKTLLKPQVSLGAEISIDQSYRQNRPESHSYQYRKFHAKLKFLLITMSFFTFLIVSDSPEIEADICNKFHPEQICNVW